MADWIPIGEFTEADVIRWREGIYRPRKEGKGNSERLGQRLVTAELLKKGDDWFHLRVCACELISFRGGRLPEGLFRLREGTTTKRKPRTIMNGSPERMVWSDEQARSAITNSGRGVVAQFCAACL